MFQEYDKSISKVFATQVNNKITFKVFFFFIFLNMLKFICQSKLDTYRNCDNVWTLLFRGIETTINSQNIKVDEKVKIVACEGKSDKKVRSNYFER